MLSLYAQVSSSTTSEHCGHRRCVIPLFPNIVIWSMQVVLILFKSLKEKLIVMKKNFLLDLFSTNILNIAYYYCETTHLSLLFYLRILTCKMTRMSAATKFSSSKRQEAASPSAAGWDAIVNIQGTYVLVCVTNMIGAVSALNCFSRGDFSLSIANDNIARCFDNNLSLFWHPAIGASRFGFLSFLFFQQAT